MSQTKKEWLPRWLLRASRRVRDLPTRFGEWGEQKRWLGKRAAWQLGWSAFWHPVGDPLDAPGPLSQIKIEGLSHAFWFREGTSDVQAIRQIFVRREYAFLERVKEVRTIVDLGANIGGAAVFLLEMFPSARVIAVEPAAGNYEVLCKNLGPYGARARAVQGAIWPTSASLQIERGAFRDGLDWSIQVKPSEAGEVCGITVWELMKQVGVETIDLLKVDIEGAERELFGGDVSWLGRVRNLCIELHDEECERVVMGAMGAFEYQMERRGETSLFEGIRGRDGR